MTCTVVSVEYTGFKYFQCKVVFLSSNTSVIPRIKQLRMIVLQVINMSNKNKVSTEDWGRDPNSGEYSSVCGQQWTRIKQGVARMRQKDSQITEMSNDINSLKEDFQELKNILLQVMNSYNKNDG